MLPIHDVAIIIPVGPQENTWRMLLLDLAGLPSTSEIILVGTTPQPEAFAGNGENIRWLCSPKGRARQLNFGARVTEKRHLWFLHADSRVGQNAIDALADSLIRSKEALHYFDLRFSNDGPRRMAVNTVGVWIRSHWMGLPFGDQGFCLSRQLFEKLGGYDENAAYGEDHLLVWAAHLNGAPLRCAGAAILTSARRYRETGWGKATASTMILTARQALPELAKLLRKRVTNVMR